MMIQKQCIAGKPLALSFPAQHDQRVCWTLALLLLSGCTRGHLDYVTPQGEHKTGCRTEYSWAPAVDRHAVDYVLAHCARGAVAQGHQVKDLRLLRLDLTIPAAPAGQRWSHQLAASQHQSGQLSDQQYGYIVAFLDLALEQKPTEQQEP